MTSEDVLKVLPGKFTGVEREEAVRRLDLRNALSEILPMKRVRVFLPGDAHSVCPASFGAQVVISGRIIRLSGNTQQDLLDQARQVQTG